MKIKLIKLKGKIKYKKKSEKSLLQKQKAIKINKNLSKPLKRSLKKMKKLSFDEILF